MKFGYYINAFAKPVFFIVCILCLVSAETGRATLHESTSSLHVITGLILGGTGFLHLFHNKSWISRFFHLQNLKNSLETFLSAGVLLFFGLSFMSGILCLAPDQVIAYRLLSRLHSLTSLLFVLFLLGHLIQKSPIGKFLNPLKTNKEEQKF